MKNQFHMYSVQLYTTNRPLGEDLRRPERFSCPRGNTQPQSVITYRTVNIYSIPDNTLTILVFVLLSNNPPCFVVPIYRFHNMQLLLTNSVYFLNMLNLPRIFPDLFEGTPQLKKNNADLKIKFNFLKGAEHHNFSICFILCLIV